MWIEFLAVLLLVVGGYALGRRDGTTFERRRHEGFHPPPRPIPPPTREYGLGERWQFQHGDPADDPEKVQPGEIDDGPAQGADKLDPRDLEAFGL